MANRQQKLKLAAFLIVTAAAGVALFSAFAGVSPWRDSKSYHVLVPGSVGGLEVGSAVTLRGVRAGAVTELDPTPRDFEGVRVTLEVDEDTTVQANARASVKFQGVTGLKLIDIEQGASTGDVLPPGANIPYDASALERLSERAEDMVALTTKLLESSDRILQRVALVSEQLDPERLNRALAHSGEIAMQLDTASALLVATLRESRTSLRRLFASADQTLGDTRDVLKGVEGSLRGVERASLALGGLARGSSADLLATTHNLRHASQSLKELSREVRLQPSRLFFSSAPPERDLP